MKQSKKASRYERIIIQLEGLLPKTQDPICRMATINALLYHKMDHFFWTGFYLIRQDNLMVGPYQGPLACQVLEKSKGVCWAAIDKAKTIIVPDVSQFAGHIACDTRSRSEIAVPYKDDKGQIRGVLDVDSRELSNFDSDDAFYLERIVSLLKN